MKLLKPLPHYLQQIAIDELGEVPSRIPEDLEALKLWLKQQPHLKACTDDQFLIQFLRGCKYSLERAKGKLDLFYTFKTKYPELFRLHDVENKRFQEILSLRCFAFLPVPLKDVGPRIVSFRINFTLEKYGVEEVFRTLNVAHDMMLINDQHACICGTVYLVDFGQITPYFASQLTPSLFKKLITYYEKAIPLRIKLICFINVSPIVEAILKIVIPIFSEKLRQRVFVCGLNLTSLAERIPLKYLPQDYGGENGYIDEVSAENNKLWLEFREYFRRNKDYGTDERLRSGDPIDFESLFGMGGSFRKLNVD